MTAMPSEKQIRDAIEQIRSHYGMFQFVAEHVMRIHVGGPYRDLVPQGRNAKLQTTIGYPDAYVRTDDGSYCLIETTAGDWRKHLDNEDLPGITTLFQTGRRVSEFNLFVMSDAELLIEQDRKPKRGAKPRVPKKSIDEYTKDLVSLGVPQGGIRFFFLDKLVAILRSDPGYVRVLADLGLPIDAAPFFPIKDRLLAVGPSPTSDEYKSRKVVAVDLLASLRQELYPGRRLLVEGGSGSGKTTLATAFGFMWIDEGREAFYVDLDVYDDAAAKFDQLIQRLKQFGSPGNLFVIDNSHCLRPEQLKQLLKASAGAANRPMVLALSRKLPESVAKALCDDVEAGRMSLQLRTQDLRAAYNLVASRHAPYGVHASPDEEQFRQWLRLYGDLVSFTLALSGARIELRAGQLPTLTEQSAIKYLNDRYLAALSTAEREVLAGVALCARFDVPASCTSLRDTEPQQSLKQGLVLEQMASNGERRFALAHPKIGGLLLKAMNKREEEVLQAVIDRDVFQACYIVQRLVRSRPEGMNSDEARRKARDILERVGASAWTFSASFSPGYCGVIASLYEELNINASFRPKLAPEIANYISQRPDFLTGLPDFLRYTAAKGPQEANKRVWIELAKAASEGRLARAASLAPLTTVQAMLWLAKEEGLGSLEVLQSALSGRSVVDAVAQKFGKVAPSSAEQLLETFERHAPRLYGQLRSRLLTGAALDPFRTALSAADDRTAIRQWLRRPKLLELIAGDANRLLPPSFLGERWHVLLPVLMDEPTSVRAIFDKQVQELFVQLARDRKVRQGPAHMLASVLMAMICLTNQTSAKQVEAFVSALQPELLAACLHELPHSDVGAILADPSSALSGSNAILTLKLAALDLVHERLVASIAVAQKRPGRIYVATHLTIAKLAGATGEEGWYRRAIALATQAPRRRLPHMPSQPRGSRSYQAHAAFRTQVDALFPSVFSTAAQ